MQTGFPEAVVEPEGLDGEGPSAGAASEPLDESAVARPMESAMKAIAEVANTKSRAAWVRATKRSVAHEILLSEARSGLGPTTRTDVYVRGLRRICQIFAT